MNLIAQMINLGVKMSGMKKKYSLPEEQFLAEVRKMNKSRLKKRSCISLAAG